MADTGKPKTTVAVLKKNDAIPDSPVATSNGLVASRKVPVRENETAPFLQRTYSWFTSDKEEVKMVSELPDPEPVPMRDRRRSLAEDQLKEQVEPTTFDAVFKKDKVQPPEFEGTPQEDQGFFNNLFGKKSPTTPTNPQKSLSAPQEEDTGFLGFFQKSSDKASSPKSSAPQQEEDAGFLGLFRKSSDRASSPKSSTPQKEEDSGLLGLFRKSSSQSNTPSKEDIAHSSAWAQSLGEGASQEDFMYKDECILVDIHDTVIGHDSKWNCHRFEPGQPRGRLHRAFSVFLFDSKDRLLLQQRAASKITFPSVWTNTCCSHQLYVQEPSELDSQKDIQDGTVMGAKRAAVRKLLHELGIKPSQVPLSKFKFLGRMHYYASDAVTHGPDTVWGEHEIDYILFIQADVETKINTEEVDAVKYVTQSELKEMMDSNRDLLWSPWFRFIMQNSGFDWWKNLRQTLSAEVSAKDLTTIVRFDPPPEHRSSAGVSGRGFTYTDRNEEDDSSKSKVDKKVEKKQGSYGKVPIHEEPSFTQLAHADEVLAAIYYKTLGSLSSQLRVSTEDEIFCEKMLKKVSRSFAAVILQLPKEMILAVLVFYLVLRGLDTVEDDMKSFEDVQEKVKLLRNFYRVALADKTYSLKGVGEGDEKELLEHFGSVSHVFQNLTGPFQEVIADICKQMGEGMAEFVSKDLGQGTSTVTEYNRYCHFVAGLVGEGLSRLFAASGKEDASIADELPLADSMGLFLQKTNIIRDFLEDYIDGRAWWPQQIWSKYSETGQLGEFALPEFQQNGLNCLNSLVTDALMHGPDCLAYMSKLKNEQVFRFCAIPQVMAIATLDKAYNNGDVFTGVAKIRKGLAVKMIVDTTSELGLHLYFNTFARSIKAKIPEEDPTALQTLQICNDLIQLTETKASVARARKMLAFVTAALIVVMLFLQVSGSVSYCAVTEAFGVSSAEALLMLSCFVYMIGVNIAV